MEFWGTFLINAAKGQKQLEDMTRWMSRGFNGFDELTDMFRKFYGLEQLPHNSPDYAKAWEKASENYKTSLNEWLEFMSVVPKKKYLALEKKYDTLRKKVASQDETIRRLQNLLSEKGVSHMDAVQSFTEMVEKQAQQFQDLMESLNKAFKKE